MWGPVPTRCFAYAKPSRCFGCAETVKFVSAAEHRRFPNGKPTNSRDCALSKRVALRRHRQTCDGHFVTRRVFLDGSTPSFRKRNRKTSRDCALSKRTVEDAGPYKILTNKSGYSGATILITLVPDGQKAHKPTGYLGAEPLSAFSLGFAQRNIVSFVARQRNEHNLIQGIAIFFRTNHPLRLAPRATSPIGRGYHRFFCVSKK